MTAPAIAVPAESILIIDFGSQVTQLIARRLRETGVYCEIHPFQHAGDAFARLRPKGVIFSGGPASVRTSWPVSRRLSTTLSRAAYAALYRQLLEEQG